MTDYYSPTTSVRVVVPRDPFTGQVGTVDQTRNDGTGDMVHRVVFRDGKSAYYYGDEIVGNKSHNAKYRPDEED